MSKKIKDNCDLDALKPKKRVNSRAKGQSFERKICKFLNSRFETKEFCRTPGSGAFATTHALPEYLKIHGDLVTPKNFRFIVECKKGYNKENLSSLLNDRSAFYTFIKQCEKDSQRAGGPSIIIWQQDRNEILAILNNQLVDDITLYSNKEYKYLVFNKYIIYKFKDLLDLDNDFWFT